MWTIVGPFDTPEPVETEEHVRDNSMTKLLRCGVKYTMTRKHKDGVRQLLVNNKRVSGHHGTIVVGEHTENDVYDIAKLPTLTLVNNRPTSFIVLRPEPDDPDAAFEVPPGTSAELLNGDSIALLKKVPLNVVWKPMTFYIPAPTSTSPLPSSLKDIADLGIKLTHSLMPKNNSVTHQYHLLPSFALTYATATSLLIAATFVRPDYLPALCRLGAPPSTAASVAKARAKDPDADPNEASPSALERTYVPPAPIKHRPTYDDALPEELKVARVWAVDESRTKLFRGARVVFVVNEEGDGLGEDLTLMEAQNLVRLGAGKSEVFAIQDEGGRLGFQRMLAKGKVPTTKGGRGRGDDATDRFVIVGDRTSLKQAGEWDGLVTEATGMSMRFAQPSAILSAIALAKMDPLDCTMSSESVGREVPIDSFPDIEAGTTQSSFPDSVPNTYSLQSAPPSSSTRLRRGSRSTPAPEPNQIESQHAESEHAQSEASPAPTAAPKRRLLRRAASGSESGAGSGAGGGEASGALPAAAKETSQDPPPSTPENAMEVDEPPPVRRTLKRRTQTAATAIKAGFDPADTSVMTESQEVLTGGLKRKTPEPESLMAPPRDPGSVTRPAGRLKRRTGGAAASTAASSIASESPLTQILSGAGAGAGSTPTITFGRNDTEPPHKKFKALFDESAGRQGGADFSQFADDGSMTQSLTQTQADGQSGLGLTMTGLGLVSRTWTGLPPVAEEEEESQREVGDVRMAPVGNGTVKAGQTSQSAATLPSEGGISGAPARGTTPAPGQGRARSVPATPGPFKPTPTVIPNSPNKKPGAAPGKPDTDTAFLKAVASTRKTRGTNVKEDEFDREFNKLRISKPDLEKERERQEMEAREMEKEEWRVLEEFGDDTGVRGNFMLVEVCEVFRKPGEGRRGKMAGGEVKAGWAGRSDFKKFRKKLQGKGKEGVVEIVAEEPEDFGIGAAYWKNNGSQSQSQAPEPVFEFSQSQGGMNKRKRSRSRTRVPSGSQLQLDVPPPSKRARSRPATVEIESDAEDQKYGDEADAEEVVLPGTRRGARAGSRARVTVTQSTLPTQSQRSTRAGGSAEKATPLFLESDGSDRDVEMVLNDDGKDEGDDDYQLEAAEKVSDDDDEVDIGTQSRTLRSNPQTSRRSTQTQSKPPSGTSTGAPIVKTRGTSRRAPIVVDEDESTFKGFRKGRARTQQ